jgi:hypothetical protein
MWRIQRERQETSVIATDFGESIFHPVDKEYITWGL